MSGKYPAKTNAARILDKSGIAYELIPYEFDESDLSATHLAETIGEDIRRVFKTIVLKGERKGHFVCVLPGDKEIDLKLAAKAIGDKKVDLIPMKDLLPLTGYIRGGCSPIGMKKSFPTFFHSTIEGDDYVYVSAGQRGLQFRLSPESLIKVTGGQITNLAKEES